MTRQNEFWLYKSYQLYIQPQKAIKSTFFLEFFCTFPLNFGAHWVLRWRLLNYIFVSVWRISPFDQDVYKQLQLFLMLFTARFFFSLKIFFFVLPTYHDVVTLCTILCAIYSRLASWDFCLNVFLGNDVKWRTISKEKHCIFYNTI